jgi:hypothetical protein
MRSDRDEPITNRMKTAHCERRAERVREVDMECLDRLYVHGLSRLAAGGRGGHNSLSEPSRVTGPFCRSLQQIEGTRSPRPTDPGRNLTPLTQYRGDAPYTSYAPQSWECDVADPWTQRHWD